MGVHPTAVIADGAQLGDDVEVGPYCVLGPKVQLGKGCKLASHVIIDGDTQLGEDCEIYPHAVIGTTPQDKKLKDGEVDSQLRIGARNQIREFCTIHGGTQYGGGLTRVGDDNMLLVGCHIGHDATVGSRVVFTNGAMAAGHTFVDDNVILGAMVGVHQFARIGKFSMVGAGAMLSKDAPPFSLVQGDRARLIGINLVGLKRAGYQGKQVNVIKRTYRKLFWRGGTLDERLQSVQALVEEHELAAHIAEFVSSSKRGLVMPRGRHDLHAPDTGEH